MNIRPLAAVAAFAIAGCGGDTLALEGTGWSSVAKKDAKYDIPEGGEKFHFERGGRFVHERGTRRSTGTYKTGSDTLSLKYDSKAVWDPGTVVGYVVTFEQDRMTLRQTAGDGPAVTTMGRVIAFKRME